MSNMREGGQEIPQGIQKFAALLEKAGYEGALELIMTTLIPLATEQGLSVLEAAWEYANPDEEQDTSFFQLFYALQKISEKQLSSLDINTPL